MVKMPVQIGLVITPTIVNVGHNIDKRLTIFGILNFDNAIEGWRGLVLLKQFFSIHNLLLVIWVPPIVTAIGLSLQKVIVNQITP